MFAKLCSGRRRTVTQCSLDCIQCHNIVLGGDSAVEVSAVCYSGYENDRPENVSSGVNILIKPKNRPATYSHLYRLVLFNQTENVIFFRLLTQSFYTVCTKFHYRPSSNSQAVVSLLFSVTKI